jgi:hypothetical protein
MILKELIQTILLKNKLANYRLELTARLFLAERPQLSLNVMLAQNRLMATYLRAEL